MAEYAFVLPEALLGEIGWIGAENLDPFRSLLLPECGTAKDDPLLHMMKGKFAKQ